MLNMNHDSYGTSPSSSLHPVNHLAKDIMAQILHHTVLMDKHDHALHSVKRSLRASCKALRDAVDECNDRLIISK